MKAHTTGGGAVLDILSDYTLGRGRRGAAASSTPRMTPARAAHLSRSARASSVTRARSHDMFSVRVSVDLHRACRPAKYSGEVARRDRGLGGDLR